MREIRPVALVGYGHYLVSSDGIVYSTMKGGARPTPRETPRAVKPWVCPDGYEQVVLHGGGRRRYKRYAVHRIVAVTFLGVPPFEGAQVCHGDANRRNNVVENLRWGTAADNASDTAKHGSQAGENNGRAKLTIEQVGEIRRLLSAGMSQTAVARRFGIGQTHVSRISRRENWKAA